MVGYRNGYIPTPDGEFVFEHFFRIVNRSGIFHPNMPINSGSGIRSLARSPAWGGCLASPFSESNEKIISNFFWHDYGLFVTGIIVYKYALSIRA